MQRKGGTRCVERNKRVAAYHVEENAQPPAWTQGFVNLNPPPCESHRGGIQVDEPFCRRGRRMVCAVQPSLLPHDAFLAPGKLTAPVILKSHRTCPSLLRLPPFPPVDSSTGQEREVLSRSEESTEGFLGRHGPNLVLYRPQNGCVC